MKQLNEKNYTFPRCKECQEETDMISTIQHTPPINLLKKHPEKINKYLMFPICFCQNNKCKLYLLAQIIIQK